MLKAPLEYDKPITISPLITRVLADNSSFMTGPGTNTYLVGHNEIAVIDPGPYDRHHVKAILHAAESSGRIKWILTTHDHPDHAPAVKLLQAETDAPLLSFNSPSGNAPARQIKHHDRIETGEFSLQAIHTPGHASNHLCFLLENENTLFSGDHIMQGSTVVIIPPSGHMKNYLESLSSLKDYTIEKIAPGHGHIIDDPIAEIDSIIEHRLEREAKVLSALKEVGGRANIEDILPNVYDDVPSFMHGMAAFSLEAHLIKLEKDGVVGSDGYVWFL